MKKAVIHGPRQAGLVDTPIPEPRGDLVLIKVRAVPMCTEYKTWESGSTAESLGHEGVGEVAAVDGHSDLAVGDRVVILGLLSCGTCRYCRTGNVMHCTRKTAHRWQHGGRPGDLVAECDDELPIRISPDMIRTGLTLIGQWHYSMNDFERLLAVVRSSPLLEQHVSHRLPMSRVQEALELCASYQCGKVILDPWK